MLDSSESIPSKLGRVITFYSYKGGVGRSMALANIGALLAKNKHKVLLLDWDLEAPGLENYFIENRKKNRSSVEFPVEDQPGIVDILRAARDGLNLNWRDCINQVKFSGGSLHLISAGKRDEQYKRRLQELDWGILYGKYNIGDQLEEFRRQLKEEYDYILVDSRTGITDIGDICTVLLPDILVTLFASNKQNIEGCKAVVERARAARQALPVNRGKLIVLPIASRDESDSEYEQATLWRKEFTSQFKSLLREWIPESVSAEGYFDRIYIPYVPFWSFGERVPVLESPREISDPKTIGASYLSISRLIERDLAWYSDMAHPGSSVDELKTRDLELRAAEDNYAQLSERQSETQKTTEELYIRLKETENLKSELERDSERSRLRLTLATMTGLAAVLISGVFIFYTTAQESATIALEKRLFSEQSRLESEIARLQEENIKSATRFEILLLELNNSIKTIQP